MKKQIRKLDFDEIQQKQSSIWEKNGNSKLPVVAVLENIRSLYNVGSMFRTADGAGIEKLYLTGYTGYPPRKEIDKTALGSTESVSWEHNTDTIAVLRHLKEQGYQLVVLEHTDASVMYTDAAFQFPVCIVLGNEVDGVTPEVAEMCHMAIEIPMRGVKQSLNVAVACGVVLYHVTGLVV